MDRQCLLTVETKFTSSSLINLSLMRIRGHTIHIAVFIDYNYQFYLMGSCFSSCQESHPTAKLILHDGGLKEFCEAVKVAEILREKPDFFVTHSDSMGFDQYLIPLFADHQLQMGHLYFLLPREKLQNPLPSSEMAAMAVMAAAALQPKLKRENWRKWRRRIKIEPEMEKDLNESQICKGLEDLKESPAVEDFGGLWKMKLSPVPEAFDY